jgi:hypothetical protein
MDEKLKSFQDALDQLTALQNNSKLGSVFRVAVLPDDDWPLSSETRLRDEISGIDLVTKQDEKQLQYFNDQLKDLKDRESRLNGTVTESDEDESGDEGDDKDDGTDGGSGGSDGSNNADDKSGEGGGGGDGGGGGGGDGNDESGSESENDDADDDDKDNGSGTTNVDPSESPIDSWRRIRDLFKAFEERVAAIDASTSESYQERIDKLKGIISEIEHYDDPSWDNLPDEYKDDLLQFESDIINGATFLVKQLRVDLTFHSITDELASLPSGEITIDDLQNNLSTIVRLENTWDGTRIMRSDITSESPAIADRLAKQWSVLDRSLTQKREEYTSQLAEMTAALKLSERGKYHRLYYNDLLRAASSLSEMPGSIANFGPAVETAKSYDDGRKARFIQIQNELASGMINKEDYDAFEKQNRVLIKILTKKQEGYDRLSVTITRDQSVLAQMKKSWLATVLNPYDKFQPAVDALITRLESFIASVPIDEIREEAQELLDKVKKESPSIRAGKMSAILTAIGETVESPAFDVSTQNKGISTRLAELRRTAETLDIDKDQSNRLLNRIDYINARLRQLVASLTPLSSPGLFSSPSSNASITSSPSQSTLPSLPSTPETLGVEDSLSLSSSSQPIGGPTVDSDDENRNYDSDQEPEDLANDSVLESDNDEDAEANASPINQDDTSSNDSALSDLEQSMQNVDSARQSSLAQTGDMLALLVGERNSPASVQGGSPKGTPSSLSDSKQSSLLSGPTTPLMSRNSPLFTEDSPIGGPLFPVQTQDTDSDSLFVEDDDNSDMDLATTTTSSSAYSKSPTQPYYSEEEDSTNSDLSGSASTSRPPSSLLSELNPKGYVAVKEEFPALVSPARVQFSSPSSSSSSPSHSWSTSTSSSSSSSSSSPTSSTRTDASLPTPPRSSPWRRLDADSPILTASTATPIVSVVRKSVRPELSLAARRLKSITKRLNPDIITTRDAVIEHFPLLSGRMDDQIPSILNGINYFKYPARLASEYDDLNNHRVFTPAFAKQFLDVVGEIKTDQFQMVAKHSDVPAYYVSKLMREEDIGDESLCKVRLLYDGELEKPVVRRFACNWIPDYVLMNGVKLRVVVYGNFDATSENDPRDQADYDVAVHLLNSTNDKLTAMVLSDKLYGGVKIPKLRVRSIVHSTGNYPYTIRSKKQKCPLAIDETPNGGKPIGWNNEWCYQFRWVTGLFMHSVAYTRMKRDEQMQPTTTS